MRLEEQADDLRRLLDRMNMYDPLAVLGVDIGGPVALLLASIDTRVNCVALVASAPRRNALSGLAGFLLRAGVLRPLLNREIRRSIATREPQPVDFDPAYDALRPREMAAVFREAVRSIPAGRLDSLIYASEAEIDPHTSSVPASLRLDIPVLQVIGEVDEAWGDQTPEEIRRQFPNFQRRVVTGAGIHKDVFFKAEAYYEVLFDLLQETCLGVK
jgi:pimeloyl-ACP methyl ester carboxylesterase